MKKSVIVLISVLATLCGLIVALTLFVRKGNCPCCRKLRSLFSDADYTVMPMNEGSREE